MYVLRRHAWIRIFISYGCFFLYIEQQRSIKNLRILFNYCHFCTSIIYKNKLCIIFFHSISKSCATNIKRNRFLLFFFILFFLDSFLGTKGTYNGGRYLCICFWHQLLPLYFRVYYMVHFSKLFIYAQSLCHKNTVCVLTLVITNMLQYI